MEAATPAHCATPAPSRQAMDPARLSSVQREIANETRSGKSESTVRMGRPKLSQLWAMMRMIPAPINVAPSTESRTMRPPDSSCESFVS